MKSRLLIAACLGLLCVSQALGGLPAPAGSGCCPAAKCCCPPPIPGCCDDYCRKPMPCTPCLPPCGTCDDYCRKPMPCVPCLPPCGTCDDYCRKPLPNFCWPLIGLRCVPACGK